jgi:alkanesulfonate monooxygenase SsuD/methylene tetrahydromethanopterin reductase-like flavin-dependent oxidoreductase (luciferase family)
MKLATEISQLQYSFEVPVAKLQLVDRLGYDLVFASENAGSDIFTPLAYSLACTKRLGVGTSLAVTSARTPACTAATFLTLKHLAGDRQVVAGIGNSGIGRIEAWHGMPWAKGAARLSDYTDIMRKVFDGDYPLTHDGDYARLPYAGPDAQYKGKPLGGLLEPRAGIPILWGTGGAERIKLTAERADGWLTLGFGLGMMQTYQPLLEAGFARSPTPKSLKDFEIWSHIDVIVAGDVKDAMKPFKEWTTRMVGGRGGAIGGGRSSVYANQMIWSGFPEAAERVMDLNDAGRSDEAAEAVPDDYIDGRFLIGPIERIEARARLWRDAGPTGLIIRSEYLDVFQPIKRALDG